MSNSNILKIGSLLNKFPNKSSKVELSQELKDKLVSVVSAYGKSNSDKDRDIIKDKTGKGNDFQILNANYKLNSSFGKYEEDFTTWLKSSKITNFDDKSFKFNTNESWILLYHKSNIDKDTPSFKIHIEIEQKVGDLYYNYVDSNGVWKNIIIKSEEFETPISYNTLYTGETSVNIGFTTSGSLKGSITQIPSLQGSFVTDGKDDKIVSIKTVQEMLEGSNDITVISMIYHINSNLANGLGYTNYIDNNLQTVQQYFRNRVTAEGFGKFGIYGYSSKNNDLPILITNILGDKTDYDVQKSFSFEGLLNSTAKFSPIGRSQIIGSDISSCAWYWTVIAKAVLTTDEINQVIAYYNLDRPGEIVKPDILYDVKRQGITNENHAEFNDELIDFSGNNYNLKLYNMLWDKQSGIGNYPISFKDYTYLPTRGNVIINKNDFTIISNSSTANLLEINTRTKILSSYKVKVEGVSTIKEGTLKWRINTTAAITTYIDILKDGIYDIPATPQTEEAAYSGWCISKYNEIVNVKVTLLAINDITDAIVLDGINNFGKVTNVPIYKDYTVAVLRKWLYGDSVKSTETGSIVSKSKVGNNGAFILEQTLNLKPPRSSTFSFGKVNSLMSNDKLNEESFTYQTKYSYNNNPIQPGTGVDSDSMWLGLIRDNDSRYSKMAIWSLLLFPYSLSEFLLERQLKKYKLGTLYPNQVEFRPIVNSNLEYKLIQYINKADGTDMVVGQYYPSDTSIQILITPTQPNKVNKITINGKEPVFINSDNGVYKYEWNFDGKSPQQIKLKLGIDETLVQFNPIINSNVEYKKEEYFIINNSIWTKINSLDYISIGQKIAIKIYLNGIVDKLIAATSLDLENISSISKASKENSYYFLANVTSKSPQNIDIVIDEYIRYEDIKQPYPVIFRLFNKDTNKEYTWGDIIKVGSIINIKSLIFSLNNFYSINGYSVNNKGNYSWMQISSMDIEVIKTLSFGSNSTWKFGQGPLFIYDPSLINNIGLKNLGYLPDITGQNNNLNLYNFEYIPNSGKGQYLIDFSENWIFNNAILKDQIVTFNRSTSSSGIFFANIPNSYKADIPSFTVNVDFTNTTNNNAPAYYYWNEEGIRQFIYLIKGKNILPINYASKSNDSSAAGSGFHDFFCDTVTIEQVAFNEEALCFDGIDNYGNIPSITNVKSILMQVKWSYLGKILYDQRKNYNSEFAIFSDDTNLNGDKIYAYQARNNGNTYIQGFLNKNLYASALKDLLHNIIITNDLTEISQNPYIGCTIETTYFSKMAMYKVMGFDKVISEDEIKLLNEDWLGLGNNFIYLNPNIQIDTTLAIKDIKLFQNNEEVNKGYLFTGAQNGVEFELRVSLAEGKYGLDEITVDGETISSSSEIDGYKVFKFTLLGTNEQNITIHTYDYIMYEDIPQPYPAFFYYNDKETKKDYIWGDKVKVGSIINVRSVHNLLYDLYTIHSYILNGESLNYSALRSKDIVVSNDLSVGCITTYRLNGSAPKCIFSPEKLRIPNSSYKYLGYIPDISGNGNNGVFNNFAFSGMSGANGYPYNYKSGFTAYSNSKVVDSETFNIIAISASVNIIKSSPTYKGKIRVTGLSGYLKLRIYPQNDSTNAIEIFKDGIYDINIDNETDNIYFHAVKTNVGSNDINIIIQQVGKYEGAFCLDGVDDFITIPTLSSGGKQVLMKVNWNKAGVLYDQRRTGNNFAIYTAENTPAYNARNDGGSTYIDGIVNNNIIASDLINITHNLIVVNNNANDSNTVSPRIGFSVYDNLYSKFALYDFMFFDDISSDEEIKELNDIIEIENNIIEWNPTITSNISSAYSFVPNIRKSDGTIVGLKIGNIYLASTTGNLVLDIVPPNKNLDEVSNVVIDGESYTPIKYPNYYRVEIPLVFPNEINVTIDEYITYETIEQPYPIFLNYIDKETNKAYTWGDKVKVDSILKISGYKNLFENGEISLGGSNGYSINGSSELVALGTLLTSEILVNKINTGVKSSVIWNLDTPKPLFAYDSSIINNIGLKNLGYLPDITGQGRHLLLNEFAYEGMSGINGYPVVFGTNKTWIILRPNSDNANYEVTPNIIKIYKSDNNSALLYSSVYNDGVIRKISVPSFKLKVTGLKEGQTLGYKYVSESDRNLVSAMAIIRDGIYDIPQSYPIEPDESTPNGSWIGFITNTKGDYDTTLEVLPDYEGSLYFDGVNDYGTALNLDHGGKCLVSKLNYNLKSSIIYDQRSTLNNHPDTNTFALVINTTNDNAYSTRLTGDIYINNILNNYISNTDLNNNIHIVTATCSIVDSSNSEVPIFGRSKTGINHAQFAMYKTILLPEVPNAADLAILNKWCGLPTGYLPKPEYYWDVTGKSNSDTATRNTIKNLGTAKPVASTSDEDAYSLENKNVAYEGMSGYNGYPVVFGANKTWKTYATYNFTSTINDNKLHITKVLNSNGLIFSYVKRNNELLNIKEIPSFKIKVTGLEGESKLLYFYLSEKNTANITILTLENGVHKIPKSFIPTNALPNNAWIGFKITSIQEGVSSFDCDITLEILPEYPNGLCLDGITNYVECANIPAFTDYTYIIKYKDFDNPNPNSCIQRKGNTKLGGGAFVHSYISTENKEFQLSFGASNGNLTNTDPIQYCTKTNYNGTIIKAGTNTDDLGITIGKWNQYRKMVFYKEMLWSKSLSSYEINMIRNLMMQDDIIDLNNLIFKK